MRFDHPRGLRQSMSWLHTWSGLVLGWLLFAIYVTGTLAFFRGEITFWMQPELHRADSRKLALERALQILEREAPDATQWSLTLPGPRNPTLGLSWQSTATPATGRGEAQREGPPEAAWQGGGRNAEDASLPRVRERGGKARGEREADSDAAAPRARAGRGEGHHEGARQSGRNAEGAGFQRAETPSDTQQARSNRARAAAPAAAGAAQRQGGGEGGGGHRGPRLLLDPATGEILQGRVTAGGNFLYRFHFELYGMDRTWGRWIVGIATLFMFAAIVSGVIVHRNIFKDFFTFRPAKGKRSWLDAHNATSVMSLPFHLVITFSGLLLFGNMMMPTAMQSAYHDDRDAYMRDMRGRMLALEPPPSGEAAPLIALAPLIAAAEAAWDGQPAGSLTITNPGDRHAIVEIRQGNSVSLAEGRNGWKTLRFDGTSGVMLESPAAASASAVQSVSNTLIMLHRGFFASPVARWLLFLAGVGGSLMIATGLVMWHVARVKNREKEKASRAARFGQRLVEVLNVAGIAGHLLAIGAYFWANRLIPADFPQRDTVEIQVFFGVWFIAFVHALIRRHKFAWIEELVGAGVLIALLPFLNAATGGLSLFGSVYLDQGLLAGFDLCAFCIGIGLLFAARRVYQHTPRLRPAKPALEAAMPHALP
ncbi:MAG: PepSY domain-containing protein [Zoogloeaceae bacterium]|jgi:uncharacterized iron-regulated membrane protein|nr:PepSY domain-containing protein [Zoogloeaceae bacterium]